MKVRSVAVVLAVVVAAVVAAVVVATDLPRRPQLRLPAASAFPAGMCRDAADVVLALGRFTYRHTGADVLPAAAYPFLREQAERLASARDAAARSAGGNAAGQAPTGENAAGQAPTGENAAGQTPTGENAAGQSAGAQSPGAENPAGESGAGKTEAPEGGQQQPGEPPTGAPQASGSQSDRPQPDGPDIARQALSTRIDALIVAIGFLRLRPGKAYDPTLLRDLETARADLQRTCISRRD